MQRSKKIPASQHQADREPSVVTRFSIAALVCPSHLNQADEKVETDAEQSSSKVEQAKSTLGPVPINTLAPFVPSYFMAF